MADEPYDPAKHGQVITPPAAVVAPGSVVRVPKEEPYDPAKHGDVGKGSSAAAPSEEPFSFGRWAATRGTNAAASLASMGRGAADANKKMITDIAKALNVPEDIAAKVALAINSTNPMTAIGQFGPSREQIAGAANRQTGLRPQNAPASWGTAGKMLDTGTEAVLGSLVFPGGGVSSLARNVVPAFVGGAASEGAGDIKGIKDTPFELPVRTVAGLLTGVGTGLAQNAVTSSGRGVANTLGPRASQVDPTAARIIARNAAADYPPPPGAGTVPAPALSELLAAHQNFLPGTPLVGAAPEGGNLVGMTRGTNTMKGPARQIIGEGARDFREGAIARVTPTIDQISPLPPAEVRAPQLMNQAGQQASPIYRQAGVADLPQQILQTQPGAPITTRVPSIGPAPFVEKQTPGPPVTTGASTNSLVLQSPELKQFLDQSGVVQGAINRTQKLSDFKNEPVTSMATLDKVYKDLGSQQTAAERAGDYGLARDIRNEKQKLLGHIDAENPIYSRAVETFADPAGLADAATLGQKLAKSNLAPEAIRAEFDGLKSDAQRQEFLGGYAGVLRNKAGGTDRAMSAADRFWNNTQTRETVRQLFGPEKGDLFDHINTVLQNDRQAARTLGKITGGSDTAPKLADVADITNGDAAGVVSDVAHHGATRAAFNWAMEKLGAAKDRVVEGRTEKVNAAIARMMMNPDPAEAVRTQGLVRTAQQQAAATAAARSGSHGGGMAGGLLGAGSAVPQQPGPADRLMQNLTGGLLGTGGP